MFRVFPVLVAVSSLTKQWLPQFISRFSLLFFGLNVPLDMPITYRQWGADLDANARQQMENACQLPVSAAAALMPDAHIGCGLPISGVLATDNNYPLRCGCGQRLPRETEKL